MLIVGSVGHAALMGKYKGLGDLLQRQVRTTADFTFAEIDEVVPGGLPASAHNHAPWWSNETDGTHSQAQSWMSAGWRVERVDLQARHVTFTRDRVTSPWAVTGDALSVKAWSQARLAFEPRGEMLEFRAALRAALKALEPAPGAGLVATYLSPNDEFVDVENVALYNVGAGSYSHLTSAGVYCERLPSPDDRHHLRYRVDRLPSPPATRLLARTTAAVPADTHTPGPWWTHFHPSVEVIEGLEDGAFTVDVTLLGIWSGASLAGVVKPMLDGLVSALHQHDGSSRADLLPRLAHLGDAETLWAALCAPAAAVLGTRRLVRVHGANIAWNPADERCHAFRVQRVPAPSRSATAQVFAL